MNSKHWTIYIDRTVDSRNFIADLVDGNPPKALAYLKDLNGTVLSKVSIDAFIQEEELHEIKYTTTQTKQSLKSMSSGEQQKNVLNFLLTRDPDYLILDHPFDTLDVASRKNLKVRLENIGLHTIIIILISRKNDALNFIKNKAYLTSDGNFEKLDKLSNLINKEDEKLFSQKIPKPALPSVYKEAILIDLKNVQVAFNAIPILKNINWTISTGEFWQLKGCNGSGKTTLLSMITGENSKGYGQELYLFGYKKGSGESIWDIKKKIGYYAPMLTHNFKGQHTTENMLISGLNDSIGLYQIPTEQQKKLADEWLKVLGLKAFKDTLFSDLTQGNQRLVMVGRAMIKQPHLLILDEPTENLDDQSAALFVALTNKIAQETKTTIIYVSHRTEVGLEPNRIFELQKTKEGSVGMVLK